MLRFTRHAWRQDLIVIVYSRSSPTCFLITFKQKFQPCPIYTIPQQLQESETECRLRRISSFFFLLLLHTANNNNISRSMFFHNYKNLVFVHSQSCPVNGAVRRLATDEIHTAILVLNAEVV